MIEIINVKKKIIHRKNISLLFTLEINNINIQYQCRSGYCGMCRIKLLKGQVTYEIKQPIAALFNAREIFPCCCEPNGNITIQI